MTELAPGSLLRQLAIFGGLNPLQLGKVRELLDHRRYDAGAQIALEGEVAGEMFVILEGEVEIVKAGPGGDSTVLTTLPAGSSCGEMSLIDAQPRSATIRATAPTLLAVISWDAMLKLYRWDLKTYTLLIMNIAREFSRRLRKADRTLAEFGIAIHED